MAKIPFFFSIRDKVEPVWRHPTFVIPVLLYLIAGLLVNLIITPGEELFMLNPYRHEPWNTFFQWATRLGEYPVFLAAGLPILWARIRAGLYILLTVLLISPVSYISKDKIAKDRPITWVREGGRIAELVVVPGVTLNGGKTSFPSGHTMAAFGLFSALTVILRASRPGLGAVLALCAILTALSRMFLVQHFLADVIGGAVIGMFIAEMARLLVYSPYLMRINVLDKRIPDLWKRDKNLPV